MAHPDDTTWDLATGIGATAMMDAAVRARASASGVIHDPFAEPLIDAVGAEFYVRIASGEADSAGAGLSGTTDLFVAATRYFDDFLACAGRAGIRQVVIVASGLDTRPYRLWWPAGTTVYELDQPEVIEFKTATLRALGATAAVHRRAVGVDLHRDWPAALRQLGFDADQPSVWLAEGLLGLVGSDVQDRLLNGVSALSATGSRFGADVAAGDRDAGQRHDPARYLQASGWATVAAGGAEVFAANGFPRPAGGDDASAPVGYLSATRT